MCKSLTEWRGLRFRWSSRWTALRARRESRSQYPEADPNTIMLKFPSQAGPAKLFAPTMPTGYKIKIQYLCFKLRFTYMITRAIFVTLTLTLAAGAALAQGTQPTGVVHYGSISLNRSEVKIPAGSFGPIDNTTDVLAGNFQAIDYSQYTPPQAQATTTTVGSCVVNVLTVP